MINERTETQMTFETALENFVNAAQSISDMHKIENFPSLPKPTIAIDGGMKFIRIVRRDDVQTSAHCFVAATDGHNKKLGAWSQGDVFKCDGWKGPAKGRRGNIFDDDGGVGRMGPYGPGYNN